MKKSVQLLGLFILLWSISGCASAVQYVPLPDQSKYVEDPNKARIYVLRPSLVGGVWGIPISDGEKPIGISGSFAFLSWERDPGETTIFSGSENKYNLPITVEKGMRYYIELAIVYGGGALSFNLIQEDEGKRILNDECKPPQVTQ